MAKTLQLNLTEHYIARINNVYQVDGAIVGRDGPNIHLKAAVPQNTLSASAVLEKIEIRVPRGSYSTQGAYNIGILSEDISDRSLSGKYYAITQAKVIWAAYSTEDVIRSVTDAQEIQDIMQYGLAIWPGTSAIAWSARLDPVILLTYSDPLEAADIAVTSAPSKIYLTDGAQIAWSYAQSADIAQKSFEAALFENSVQKAVLKTASSSTHSCTFDLQSVSGLPAETVIGQYTYKIGVRVTTANGTKSGWAYSPAISLLYAACVPVSPSGGENVIAGTEVTLVWKKSPDTPSVNDPVGFVVSYSTNGGESWEALSLNTADVPKSGETWEYSLEPGILPRGTVQWRVLARNTPYAVTSSAKKETFFAVVQASTGAVQCDGKPIPTVSWESTSQAAFQVRFADYESGAVFGTAKSFTVPRVYRDGLYAVQVRTQAETGEWSAWTEKQYVQISNTDIGESVALRGEKTRHAVRLSWDASADFPLYVLYRGNTIIYAGEGKTFMDVEGIGENTYIVRAVTADRYYTESAPVTMDGTPKNDCLFVVGSEAWIPLKYSSYPRRRNFSDNVPVTYSYYAGRRKPVAFTDGRTERQGSFSYCFRTMERAQEIVALCGSVVVYKGMDGSVIRGVLNSAGIASEILRDVNFAITEIDAPEVDLNGNQTAQYILGAV